MSKQDGQMKVAAEERGVKILKASGSFTADTIPELQKVCEGVAKDKSTKAILIDFSSVEAIDTAAFACMINFMKKHTEEGINIGAVNLNQKEKEMLEVLRIEKIIHIFENEKEAIDKLSQTDKNSPPKGCDGQCNSSCL